jgi:hypothetical protein
LQLELIAKIASNEFKAKCIKHISFARAQIEKDADIMVQKIIHRARMGMTATVGTESEPNPSGTQQKEADTYCETFYSFESNHTPLLC